MKDRLVQLLDLEQLSPSKFADIIGVQRSSVSHVLSGRNKPSFDFLQKTLKAFPGLNAEWLILGKGTMYEQMGRVITGTLFDSPEESSDEQLRGEPTVEGDNGDRPSDLEASEKREVDQRSIVEEYTNSDIGGGPGLTATPSASDHRPDSAGMMDHADRKRIVRVMLFFTDDTFRSYTPSDQKI